MKHYSILFLLLASLWTSAQNKFKGDSLVQSPLYTDSLIQDRLVSLALKNPAFAETDALIGSAQYELKRAKAYWLNTISMSGNINEFVVNNTTVNGLPASTLYPKYNFGINLPLGIFGRQEKNISKEKIKLYEAQKETRIRAVKKAVLIAYENYKEKKELLEFQKQLTNGQYSTYQQKQKDFASREINDIKEVNQEYELWIEQRGRQRTREKELTIAELELEELIGMSLTEAVNTLTPNTLNK